MLEISSDPLCGKHRCPDTFSSCGMDRRLISSRVDELQIGSHMQPRGNRDVVKKLHALLMVKTDSFDWQRRKSITQRSADFQIIIADAKTILLASGNHAFAAESKTIEL